MDSECQKLISLIQNDGSLHAFYAIRYQLSSHMNQVVNKCIDYYKLSWEDECLLRESSSDILFEVIQSFSTKSIDPHQNIVHEIRIEFSLKMKILSSTMESYNKDLDFEKETVKNSEKVMIGIYPNSNL